MQSVRARRSINKGLNKGAMINKQNIKHVHVMISQKPRPDGPASALQNPRPGQSHQKANKLARPGLADIGLGLAGLTTSGRAGTSLIESHSLRHDYRWRTSIRWNGSASKNSCATSKVYIPSAAGISSIESCQCNSRPLLPRHASSFFS